MIAEKRMPLVCQFSLGMGVRQLRMRPGTAMEQAEDQANQQAFIVDVEQQQLGQVLDVVIGNDILPVARPQITMNGPPTTLSRKPYQGNVEAAKIDGRYVQMEKEVARFVWKDEDDQKIANALVASLVDNLTALELRSFICVPGISQRLKRMLKDRLEQTKQAEHERYLVWKEEKRFKG